MHLSSFAFHFHVLQNTHVKELDEFLLATTTLVGTRLLAALVP
jgi:hypothetical protein